MVSAVSNGKLGIASFFGNTLVYFGILTDGNLRRSLKVYGAEIL